jgi:hypothetical protein
MLQFENIFIDVATTDAAVNFDLHVVTKSKCDFLSLLCQFSCWWKNQDLGLSQLLIYRLQCSNGENACFSCTALALHNYISTLSDGKNSSLLDRRRLIKAIGINSYNKKLNNYMAAYLLKALL